MVGSIVRQVDPMISEYGILDVHGWWFWQKHYVQERQIYKQNKYLLQ